MGQLLEVELMREDDFKRARQGKLSKELSTIDTDNVKTMKSIEKLDPKYAKHMFLRNDLIKNFAMSKGGGIDILDQPVCTQCERPSAWNDEGSAYCFACNKNIPAKDVITVAEYLIEYTKGFSEEQLEILNKLGGRNDEIIR